MPLSNAQYNSILRIFDEKQLRNRRDRDTRAEAAYAKYPRLREIDEEIAALSLAAARKSIASGAATDLAGVEAQISALAEERRILLIRGGFPEDQLEETYDCIICGDTGFVDGEKCSCFLREESRLLYAQSNLDRVLEEENFDHFSLDFYSDALVDDDTTERDAAAAALAVAREFVANFGRRFENLYICGPVGTGKTFLTHCIAKELLERDIRVLYFTASQFFDILGRAMIQRDSSLADAPSDILACDLLIIDDLGSEFTNSFVSSQLFNCINERILQRRPTIISTNLSLAQMQELYSERSTSRIIGSYRIVELYGQDIRKQKQSIKGDLP